MTDKYLVLWDGECGFCRRSVDWLLKRDQKGELEAVPYQMASSPPMTAELRTACARAVHLVSPDGTIYSAGRAVLKALELVGYGALARVASWPPFVWFVELGYWLVARNRYFFSRFLFKRRAN